MEQNRPNQPPPRLGFVGLWSGICAIALISIIIAGPILWINNIQYNVQRLSTLTHDAVAGLSEQLAAASRMAAQNQKALEKILKEKGGVCPMTGDQSCSAEFKK